MNIAIARVKLGRTLLREKRFRDAEAESRSGYAILKAQMKPSVSWLKTARMDLGEIYKALGDVAMAAEFRQ